MTKTIKLFIFAAVVILLGISAWPLHSQGSKDPQRPRFAKSELVIEMQSGKKILLTVEIARTEREQKYGLMFVRHLADDEGMIFLFDDDVPLSFWMRNTFIPLDLLFLQADGRIINIVANAAPLDDTPLQSVRPGRAVLEINGGLSERLGIQPGDRVLLPE